MRSCVRQSLVVLLLLVVGARDAAAQRAFSPGTPLKTMLIGAAAPFAVVEPFVRVPALSPAANLPRAFTLAPAVIAQSVPARAVPGAIVSPLSALRGAASRLQAAAAESDSPGMSDELRKLFSEEAAPADGSTSTSGSSDGEGRPSESFILSYRGVRPIPPAEIERMKALVKAAGGVIVDDSAPRLLVTGDAVGLKALVADNAAWTLSPQVFYAPPAPVKVALSKIDSHLARQLEDLEPGQTATASVALHFTTPDFPAGMSGNERRRIFDASFDARAQSVIAYLRAAKVEYSELRLGAAIIVAINKAQAEALAAFPEVKSLTADRQIQGAR